MRKHLGVHKRAGSSVWQWHIKRPKDLASLYETQWAHRCSLGTSDLKEANRKAAHLQAEWLERFALQRRQLVPEVVPTLTPELLQTIKDTIRYRALHWDRKMRDEPSDLYTLCLDLERIAPSITISGGTPGYLDPMSGISDHERKTIMLRRMREFQGVVLDLLKQELTLGLGGRTHGLAETITAQLGFAIDWSRPENRKHLPGILETSAQAWTDALKRHEGQIVPTPSEPPAPALPQRVVKHTLLDAFSEWNAPEKRRDPKTVKALERAARMFPDLLPGKSLEDLTEDDGDKIVAALERWSTENKKSSTTAANILAQVKTLLSVAKAKKWSPCQPLAGKSIKRAASKRTAWTPKEVVTLFNDPLFQCYDIPKASKAGLDAAYWVPLLGLFTGARISELCQLQTSDLEETSLGLVIEFRDDEEAGQKLKNEESRRAIPVHSELIRLGFLEYWRTMHAVSPGPLFPAIRRDGDNGAGGQFGQWFGQYKKTKGFKTSALTFHSFRHTFETELGFAGVTQTQVDALTGHAGQGIGRKVYGASMRRNADRLRDPLEQLRFPGLQLPKVYTEPRYKPDNSSQD